MKRSEPGWYFFYWHECPVCGRSRIIERQKRPLPKPADWNERNEIADAVCGGHLH